MASDFKLAPSILSADFSDLRSALKICDEGGAHWIHIDVMDNQFVPNLTLGPPIVKKLRPHSKKYFDVHMMVIEPEKLVDQFANAGADGITFHVEASDDPQMVIDLIHDAGKDAGLSIKPKTPLQEIEPFLESIEILLVMSVEPGFGGQGYVGGSTERIRELRAMISEKGLDEKVSMVIDGGVKLHNAKEVLDAGVDVLVAGSEVFESDDPVGTIKSFYDIGNS